METMRTGRIALGGAMAIDEAVERSETANSAFERLVGLELPGAYRLAAYLLCDPFAAEDAVGDAVLRAWRSFPTLRDRTQFRPWLQRIVANVCRDQRRRRRLVTFVPLDGSPDEPDVADPFRASLDRDVIGRAMAGLSVEQREVVVLRYLLGLTSEEIGDRLGISPGTARSRLHYAFAAMKPVLDREVVR